MGESDDSERLPVFSGPALTTPSPAALTRWAAENRALVHAQAERDGALLFRGYGFRTVEEFEAFAVAVTGGLGDHVGSNADRQRVRGRVYTSSDAASHGRIRLHNEASYLPRMPRWVLLYCANVAETGGQTPLASSRAVFDALDPEVRSAFTRRRVQYINRLHSGFGLGRSWQTQFGSADRATVETFLRASGYSFRWTDDGLDVAVVCDAVRAHPATGEHVWVAQVDTWHPATLPEDVRSRLTALVDTALPNDVRFGDGEPIPDQYAEHIHAVTDAQLRTFDWQTGDVLVLDNFLVAHGRMPYTGDRQVFVAVS